MAQDSLEIRRTTRQADVGVANRDGFWSNYGFTPGFVSIVYFFLSPLFAGNYHWWNPLGGGDVSFDLGSQDLLKALGCMVLSGPFLTGYTQVRRF